jgi:hypothetical protein
VKYHLGVGLLPVSLILGGCLGSSANSDVATKPVPDSGQSPQVSTQVKGQPTATRLKLLNEGADIFNDITNRKALPSLNQTPENSSNQDPSALTLIKLDLKNDVFQRCGWQRPKNAQADVVFPLIAAAAGWAITQIVTGIIDGIDSELQDEVKKYTHTYSAITDNVNFYSYLGSDADKKSKFCFRFSRVALADLKDPKSNPTLVTDFVGEAAYDPARPEVVALKPVRIYYTRIDTPTSDGRAVATFKLTAEAYWLSSQQGETKTGQINTALVSATINDDDLAKGPFYKVYPDSDAVEKVVPLPPWNNRKGAAAKKRNLMNVGMTLTEVGDVPWLLKNAASLFDKNKDSIAKSASSEAESAAGVAPAKAVGN